MKSSGSYFLIFLVSILFISFTPKELPEGWFKAGSEPEAYDMGLDNLIHKDGSNSAYIESLSKSVKGFGTLMQTCSAKQYLNKKVKMTGYIKAEKVKGWAGLWLRVDGEDGSELSFDNMGDRPIKGTKDWVYCEIILAIPENSKTLNFGALLANGGKIWFDSISFEVVEDNVKLTSKHKKLDNPTNLNFDN